jgi:Ca-activated chloride channel family protein
LAYLGPADAAPGHVVEAFGLADEVWVIARPDEAFPDAALGDAPGAGELRAKLPGQEKEILLPLKHTDVKAAVSGYIATVRVKQQYHNPYDTKIEAVYVFPLPQNAAVNEFIMTIGERKIRGIIREKEEAEQIYAEARRQGYVASLLTQQRPNIFTQSVANIEPKKEIDIDIKYFNTLRYEEGEYEFVFPMVVGPRFNPPGTYDGVGAVARGERGKSGQKTEVEYLKPNERSGHDISLSLDIDAGVEIEKVWSTSHAIETDRRSPGHVQVALSQHDALPNKDFVLRYRVAGDAIKSAFLAHCDKEGGYFTLMLYPPSELASLERSPMEMIFVLDCSGSMSGQPINAAKEAIRRSLKKLGGGDSFQLIRFSNNASQLGPRPLEATPKNVNKALRHLKKLEGSGGTMMIEGIKAALDFPHDDRRLRVVSFMTDGYIGNESEILGEVRRRLGASRIFSFGVGSSPNRNLIERMAGIGRGAVAYVGLDGGSGLEAVDTFYDRISHPAMTDIEIDWGGMEVTDVFPRRVPDLFVGRPVILTGRFRGDGNTTVRIFGKAADSGRKIELPIDLDTAETHPALPQVWARMQIVDLSNRAMYAGKKTEAIGGRIKELALNYGLMSNFTAFVAVDSLTRTNGEFGVSVNVPVPVPDGVRYETTVTE